MSGKPDFICVPTALVISRFLGDAYAASSPPRQIREENKQECGTVVYGVTASVGGSYCLPLGTDAHRSNVLRGPRQQVLVRLRVLRGFDVR
ncbi:uncharacterized protein [Dermacentor andersoni]|nr:uncharacterized protein LOC129382698 isoform X5 [Dermacentor andersoni]